MSLLARIALLSYHTSPLAPLGGAKAGGMNFYVRQVAAELAAGGIAVDVFTRREDPGAAEIEQFAPGARLISVPAGPQEPLTTAAKIPFTDQFAAAIDGFREREALRYDLLHSHYWLSVVAGERLARLWHAPHLATFHTLAEVKLRARASEREPQERIEAEHRLVHAVDGIVVATSHERQLLRQIYRVSPGRVTVIPQGVDLDQFQPRERSAARAEIDVPQDERLLLAVGRIEPLKGFDILIHALALMTERERITLIVAGGDAQAADEFARLEAIADQVGVRDRVHFVGSVPHERIGVYYNAADVVVVPSFYESFGLVALEAMASCVPVVASRVGGLTTTIADGRTGYLIPWRCPEPFAEKIDLLLGNAALRARLGEAARESMTQYTWSRVGTESLALYESAVAAAASAAPAAGD